MRRLICMVRGHQNIPVRAVGLTAKPGGMLPVLDGYVTWQPADDGPDRACRRCGTVTIGASDA